MVMVSISNKMVLFTKVPLYRIRNKDLVSNVGMTAPDTKETFKMICFTVMVSSFGPAAMCTKEILNGTCKVAKASKYGEMEGNTTESGKIIVCMV